MVCNMFNEMYEAHRRIRTLRAQFAKKASTFKLVESAGKDFPYIH